MKLKPFILERKEGVVRMPPGVHRFADHLTLEADERGVKSTIYCSGGKAAGGYRSSREEVMEEVDAWCGADASKEIRDAVDDWMRKARAVFQPEPEPEPEPVTAAPKTSAKKASAKSSARIGA